ncbi:MAG: hypothetical protein RR547_04850 [Raoultibacter sp.]
MELAAILKRQNLSAYQCAKVANIPYTSLHDVLAGKTRLEKCSADMVYRLSKVLKMSMEEILEKCRKSDRLAFETFKSFVCHEVKRKGDLDFIIDKLQADEVTQYWDKQWYPEAFYLLAMLDYLCKQNDIPCCNKYDSIRSCSLKEPIYPRDIVLASRLSPRLNIEHRCLEESLPEFRRFNIVERSVRDVV